MGVVRGFNNCDVQNWRFVLVFPQQKIKLVINDTYWNGSTADFCKLPPSSAHFADAAAPFLLGAVFNLCFDRNSWIYEKRLEVATQAYL